MSRNRKYYKRRFGELTAVYHHHLDLRPYSDLDDEGFAYIMENVKGIDMLDLNETEISDNSIQLLPELEYVRELRLRDCHLVTDRSVQYFNKINMLTFLYLKGTSVTIDGLLGLGSLPHLKTLHFEAPDNTMDISGKMLQLKNSLPACEFVVNSAYYSFPPNNQ